METYNFETVINESNIIMLPADIRKLTKHRVRFTVSDLGKAAPDVLSGMADVDDRLLGLFSDEPGLIDEITKSAMRSREKNPLRYENG